MKSQSNTQTAFITGTSSGLGLGLAQYLSEQNWAVYGCSRRGCPLSGVHDRICDLTESESMPRVLQDLLADVAALDLVVLNAGMLGRIEQLTQTPLSELKQVMEINVWANKRLMDWLHAWGRPIEQIIMISSGAAVLGNKGWAGYALSKATLNMLAKLYAHEFPTTHITALAPGIIDTPMMDYLCNEADAEAFPALQRLQQARGTSVMPGPLEAAERLVSVLPRLKQWPSGSFVDIREILDPDGYARLYAKGDRR
jgi:NAD(P)-dependent dehydrogenase (short-subunit alcohol dehydrogenase family)